MLIVRAQPKQEGGEGHEGSGEEKKDLLKMGEMGGLAGGFKTNRRVLLT